MLLKSPRRCSLGLAGLLLAACGGSAAPEQESRDQLLSRTWEYNIVVVLLDAARSDHFGYLGYDRSTTPNIDALAARSLVFEQAYAQASGTATSIYSMFSSRYPVFEKVPRLVGQNAILLDEEATTLMEAVAPRHPHRLVLSTNPFVREYLGLTQGATKVIEDWRIDSRSNSGEAPRIAEPVELVDLMPTLLELMGIPIDELDLVGKSLVDIMLAGEGDAERLVHARSNRTDRPAYALREGRWKWILRLEDERQELYDLVEDPGEQFDLVAAGSADASQLEYFGARLGEWLEHGRIDTERAAPVDNRMLDESMIESLRSLGYIE